MGHTHVTNPFNTKSLLIHNVDGLSWIERPHHVSPLLDIWAFLRGKSVSLTDHPHTVGVLLDG